MITEREDGVWKQPLFESAPLTCYHAFKAVKFRLFLLFWPTLYIKLIKLTLKNQKGTVLNISTKFDLLL